MTQERGAEVIARAKVFLDDAAPLAERELGRLARQCSVPLKDADQLIARDDRRLLYSVTTDCTSKS